jgi:hypothetical protein
MEKALSKSHAKYEIKPTYNLPTPPYKSPEQSHPAKAI